MHSHTQHFARYCMLSHFKPHVPNVKECPKVITDTIMRLYCVISDNISELFYANRKHPFACNDKDCHNNEVSHRKTLRKDLLESMLKENDCDIDLDTMFESSSIQPTALLGFHTDSLNFPEMDNKIACFVPIQSNLESNATKCLSCLYYSRKCISDHAKRLSKLESYLSNPDADKLTKLCINSRWCI
jgi:hypothetical protein